jgi:oxygen-independent coproporphyrinogen III oxidase
MLSSDASSIYIHLPFCKSKCPYCDFASFADSFSLSLEDAYLEALKKEILFRSKGIKPTKKIKTVFFGGGTPNFISPQKIFSIIRLLKDVFDFEDSMEVSLEANPGVSNDNKKELENLYEAGINRISFGAQSFNPLLLKKLERGHELDDSLNMIQNLKVFSSKKPLRWSFDLIYGIPSETEDSWQDTLKQALSFNPKHISAYALSIEKNTPFGNFYKDSEHPDLPNEEKIISFYTLANEKFAQEGLDRYEISNWARAGEESLHNLNYWKAKEYYAFGLSSHGYLSGIRYSNTSNLKRYIDLGGEIPLEGEEITEDEKIREKILLGMRLKEGLNLDDEIIKFIDENQLSNFITEAYILEKNRNISLSLKGILLSNRIINGIIK